MATKAQTLANQPRTTSDETPATINMQNKPNFKNAKMNISLFITKDYENKNTLTITKNKPNSNPIQTQFQRKQTQSNPIFTKIPDSPAPKTELNELSTTLLQYTITPTQYENKPHKTKDMDLYHYIAWVAIVLQLLFLLLAYRNYRYALSKYKRRREHRPRTVLLVPCKGRDLAFEKNITSFFNQDNENYLLWFIVADQQDPAYTALCKLKEQLTQSSKAIDIQVLIAGQSQSCSQKLHNLLYAYRQIPEDIEVLAFADSDACVRNDWLSHLVYPLRQPKNGAASGYRWFVPKTNNLASLALSAINGKIAQLLGNTIFNQAWGGSMAIRVDVFRQVGLDKIWQKAVSDDLSLSYAIKAAGKKVAFVPACLVASYESTTWPKLFEFARRQFIITRVSAPRTWWFGLCCSLGSVLGLWGGASLAIYAAMIGHENLPVFTAVPIVFFTAPLIRAILRQKMIGKLLAQDRDKLKFAMAADILFFWVWSILMAFFILSSAFGRTIRWRGIQYKLLSPTETIILTRDE